MLPTENDGASWMPRVLGVVLVGLFTLPASGQSLGTADAVGIDSFKNQLLGLDFDAGTVTPRNTDNDGLQKINTVELAPSRCEARVDAFVADQDGGRLLRYRNAQGNGDLVCDPATDTCPLAPNGVARDRGGILAVGDKGIRNRDTARVWLVAPESCPEDSFAPPVLLDDDICAVGGGRNGNCQSPETVVDVEFLNRPIADYDEGSLLVLTQRPTVLLHYPADLVDCTVDGSCDGSEGSPETLLFFTDRSERRPSGLALLPGGEVLVAFDDGFIKTVLLTGSEPAQASTLFATGLDPNLAGIDGGYLDGEEVVIAARRPSGEFFKLAVSRDSSNMGEPTGTVVAIVDDAEIQSRDVAINSLQQAIDQCLEGEVLESGLIRICEFPEIDLIFNGLDNVPPGYTATILQSRVYCEGTDISVPRELPLSGLGLTGEFGDLVVPENIVGFPIDENCRALVLLEIGDTFAPGEIDPDAWIEYDFNPNFLGDLGTCRENYGRIGYHPVAGTPPLWPNGDPSLPGGEGDQFADTTVACFNPPRGMGRENSFVVIGASRLKTLWEESPGSVDLAYVKNYALENIDYLITTLNNVLVDDFEFQQKLLGLAQSARSSVAKAGLEGVSYDAAFAEGRDVCAVAAVLTAESRERFAAAPEVGDVLSRFANCALFLEEEGRGGDWTAPYYGLAGQTPPAIP